MTVFSVPAGNLASAEKAESALTLLQAVDRPNFRTYWQTNPDLPADRLNFILEFVKDDDSRQLSQDASALREFLARN